MCKMAFSGKGKMLMKRERELRPPENLRTLRKSPEKKQERKFWALPQQFPNSANVMSKI